MDAAPTPANVSRDAAELREIDELPIDRVDELLSLFFDDCLSESDFTELNDLLLSDRTVRDRCVEAAQLHADLLAVFGGEKRAARVPDFSAIQTAASPATV